jgi:hypothetical protein
MKHLTFDVSWHDRHSDTNFIEIEKLADQINIIIHKLEYFSRVTENEKFCCENYPHKYLQTFINIEKNKQIQWFEFTEEEQQLYHSSDHSCDVIFGNCILGKTYFVSFLQEEKFASPSISAINGTWGSIEILLDQNRKQIYNSLRFSDWLGQELSVDTALLDFPVGNIDSSCDPKTFAKNIAGKEFIYRFNN